MLRCFLPHSIDAAMCSLPPQNAVMHPPPPSVCCDVFFSTLRMMRCVLPYAQAAAQAVTAKKVDHHHLPPHEEAAHYLPPHSGRCDVFPPPSRCCDDVSSPPSQSCDVSSQPSGCCRVFSLKHRMKQCVLSSTQVAEQAVVVQKVDKHAPPPPEDVHAVEEDAHHRPPNTVQVSPSLPGCDDVCDRQIVTDEQGGIVVSVFLLSHIPRRFFPQLLLPSLSYLSKPPPPTPSQDQYMPCPTTLLHIPQPSLPMAMVRARTTTPPRPCVSPYQAVQCSGTAFSGVSEV